jgi:3',5'-cyclic AMP phosphodiesterase CpdA
MRVWALSDIHVDHAVNYRWIKGLSNDECKHDALILAGDVTHRADLLAETFEILLSKFAHVFFVPGNHELWVQGSDSADSLEKHSAVLRLCATSGVHTEPRCLGESDGGVAIVPLFS